MKIRLATLGGAAIIAAASIAPAQAQPARVSIPYAASGNIASWFATDERSIFLRDRGGRWYRAEFTGPCKNVLLSQPVSFQTDALGNFDEFSSVRTRDYVCHVKSITRSADPRKS